MTLQSECKKEEKSLRKKHCVRYGQSGGMETEVEREDGAGGGGKQQFFFFGSREALRDADRGHSKRGDCF